MSRALPLTERNSMKKLVLIGMLVLGGTFCLAASSAGPGPSFAAPRSYPAGPDPVSVAVGDLNGDGELDLVTANTAGTLSVLLNGGNGSFSAKVDYATGPPTASVAIGDLNGDGKADLVTGNVSTGRFPLRNVVVLINRGDGSFARVEYSIGLGHAQLSVAIGDLNGDGKLDVAAADDAHNSVSVLLNDGTGRFQMPVDYETGSLPLSIAVSDLNGDGKADLATANTFGSSVSVLLNAGNGTLRPKVDYATGPNPQAVAIGDLSGDGKADLATANGNGANTVSVLLGRGDGSFSAKVDAGVGRGPSSIAIVDLNGDHKPDLATANAGSNSVTALSHRGDGHVQTRTDVRTGSQPRGIAFGDLNGDGRTDLVTADGGANAVSVLVNTTVSCKVPRVVKKTLPAAKRAIARAHCRVGTLHRTSSRIKRGRVVSQKPKPGTVMPAGGRVNLVVSRGRKRS
jgi:FG-GAP-like repeat/PASTA domain/FG-GAP repeat